MQDKQEVTMATCERYPSLHLRKQPLKERNKQQVNNYYDDGIRVQKQVVLACHGMLFKK